MPPKLLTYNLRPPKRGVNRRDDATNLKSDLYLSDAENIVPFESHTENRKGFTKFNTVALDAIPAAVNHHVDSLDNEFILANDGNLIKKITSAAITNFFPVLPSIPMLASIVNDEQDVIFGSDVGNRKIDTENNLLFDLGLPTHPIIANTNLTEGGANTRGWLNEGKKVRYAAQYIRKDGAVIVDRGGITRPKVSEEGTIQLSGVHVPATPTVGNDVKVSLIASLNTSVTHIVLYKTLSYDPAQEQAGAVEIDFFFIAELTNINQVFTDTLPDGITAQENDLVETFGFQPLPASGIIEKIDQRTFSVDPDRPSNLAFTHNAGRDISSIFAPAGQLIREIIVEVNPETGQQTRTRGSVVSQSGIFVTPNGLPITALKVNERDLYIWTALKTYRLRNAATGELRRMEELPGEIGVLSKDGIAQIGALLIVNTNEPQTHAVRFIDGNGYSGDISDFRHEKDMEAITDFTKTRMIQFRDQVWLGVNQAADSNNKVLAFKNIDNDWAFFRHSIAMEFGVTLSDGTVVTFDAKTRFFFKQNDGFTDDGKAIKTSMTFVPIKGENRRDIVTLINGFLDIDQDFFFEIRDLTDQKIGGGLTVELLPDDGGFTLFGNSNWNVYDPIDAASGFFKQRLAEIFPFQFSSEATGFKHVLVLNKQDAAQWRFKGLEIQGTLRKLR